MSFTHSFAVPRSHRCERQSVISDRKALPALLTMGNGRNKQRWVAEINSDWILDICFYCCNSKLSRPALLLKFGPDNLSFALTQMPFQQYCPPRPQNTTSEVIE